MLNMFTNPTAVRATLHCLTGCGMGEILGLVLGMALGLSEVATIALAVVLAFIFGYLLSLIPLMKSSITMGAALSIALAADTLSITTMEVVDSLVMLVIPGAMDAGLANPIFWFAMFIALCAAFVTALPVNNYLIKRGKGHALTHAHHNHQKQD